MDLSAGTIISDRYTIEELIGEGGMALVYRARHNQLGTLHALKVLTLTSRAVRERLLQEGRVQAQLRHPNIVAVTDVIEIHGQPGLVMELVEGPSLDELVKQQKLTLEQADAIARGVLAGVGHAHSRGLIHRDLKPANVMLQITQAGLVPKVTDFGLAKIMAGDDLKARTRTGATMGTPQYMSPEQIHDSKNVDARSDVFAVGAILYELVTGERAFDGDNLLSIFSKVANGEFEDPRSLRPDLPDRMLDAISRALVVDPEARVPSCNELFGIWTAGEAMPARSFSAEDLAGLAQSMLSAPSAAQVTSELELPNSADTIARAEPISASPRSLAPSLMVGGGLMAIGAGLLALVVLIAVGIGVMYSRKADTIMVDRPVVIERTVEVEAAPRDTRAPAVPTTPAVVDPDPTRPVPVSDDPDADVPAVADVAEPALEDTDRPRPGDPDDPLSVVTGEEGMAWEDLPEEMQDPAFEPETPEVAEVEEPSEEPEVEEPEVEEPPALNSLPMSFRTGGTDLRRSAIERAQGDAAMTKHFVTLVRRSNNPPIRQSAYAALMYQWENGIGDRAMLQEEAARGIRGQNTWIKWRGLEAWARKGTSLQAPTDALADMSDVKVRWLAARALSEVAQRTGQQAEAGRILSGRAAVESHGRVLKELERQTGVLGG